MCIRDSQYDTSRKFVYAQKEEASDAINEVFSGEVDDSKVLFYIPVIAIIFDSDVVQMERYLCNIVPWPHRQSLRPWRYNSDWPGQNQSLVVGRILAHAPRRNSICRA